MFGVWGYRFFAVLIFGKNLDEEEIQEDN